MQKYVRGGFKLDKNLYGEKVEQKKIQEELDKNKEELKKLLKEILFLDEPTMSSDTFEIIRNKKVQLENFIGEKIEEIVNAAGLPPELQILIYSHVYLFFKRYYEKGDFIPHKRWSTREHKYVIPYNGEEVVLHWATKGNYYVKTSILFRDCSFSVGEYKVNFRVKVPEIRGTSPREDRNKVLTLVKDGISFDRAKKELTVWFEFVKKKEAYETIVEENKFSENDDEENSEGPAEPQRKRTNQEDENEGVAKYILEKVRNEEPQLFERLSKSDEKTGRLFIDVLLAEMTEKNRRDFFIHKNLREFFVRELDFYIKNEVLKLDEVFGSEEDEVKKRLTVAKVVHEISEGIIDILYQIEEFYRKLWEKKKFVLKTDYVITLERIKEWTDKGFLEEVIKKVMNKPEQLEEWKDLLGEDIKKQEDLIKEIRYDGEIVYKTLPIDTKYFDDEFKIQLLAKISENKNIDDVLDGVLIKSDNWQALNLLLEKYRGQVQTIYIDPPFNKEQEADYLYSVKYKDSTWITLLENRLRLAKEMLADTGSIFVRCDYNGNMFVRLLMDEIFGEENFRNEILINRKRQAIGTPNKFEIESESLFLYSKTDNYFRKDLYKPRSLSNIKWSGFLKQEERHPPERKFFDKVLYPPPGQHFSLNQEKVDKLLKENYLRLKCKECGAIYYYDDDNSKENFIDKIIQSKYKFKYMDITNNSQVFGVKSLDKCLVCEGDNWKVEYLTSEEEKITDNWKDIPSYEDSFSFKTENSEILLKRVIESTSNEEDLVLDFFLGSGTTTAVAHKLKRRWIGVEVGAHFDRFETENGPSGVLVRMKEVLAGYGNHEPSGISKEVDWKGGGFFKYQFIEQYDDTLLNIRFKEPAGIQTTLEDVKEYFFSYMLDVESRDSSIWINVDKILNPFSYTIKGEFPVNVRDVAVDLIETVNYLLGVHFNKIQTYNLDGRKYIVVRGTNPDGNVVIIWRNMDGLGLEENTEYLKKELEFVKTQILKENEIVVLYINGGDTIIPNAIPVEKVLRDKLLEG